MTKQRLSVRSSMDIKMNSNILKVLCKDCVASVMAFFIVVLIIISVAITSIASQYRIKIAGPENEIRHSEARNEAVIKRKNMEIEELVRSGEVNLVVDDR